MNEQFAIITRDNGDELKMTATCVFRQEDKTALVCQRLRCVHNDIACLMNRTKSIQWKYVTIPVIYQINGSIVIMNVQTIGYSVYPKVQFTLTKGNDDGFFEVVNTQPSGSG